jgi:SAM-dependent methyltransferase
MHPIRLASFLALGLLACGRQAAAEPGPADLLVVEVGCQGPQAAIGWAKDGRRLIQALTTRAEVVKAVRTAVDGAGLSVRVAVRQVPDFKHLPYATALLDCLVIDDWAQVDPAEVRRVVAPGGRVIVRTGGAGAGAALQATRGADGAWVLPVNSRDGRFDHSPTVTASGLQIVADAFDAKRNFPSLWADPEPDLSGTLESARPSAW